MQSILGVHENRGGGFHGISRRPISRQKRESYVWVIQSFALDQPANPDRRPVSQASGIQTEAIARVAVHRSMTNIIAGVREGPDAFVADEADESGLVQQLQNKFGVVEIQFAQIKPRSPDDACRLNSTHLPLPAMVAKPNASANRSYECRRAAASKVQVLMTISSSSSLRANAGR